MNLSVERKSSAWQILRLPLSVLVVYSLISGLNVVGWAGLADIQVMYARSRVGQLRATNAKQPDIAEWGKLRNILSASTLLTPADAQLYEALAQLYAIRAESSSNSPGLYNSFIRQIVECYSSAVGLRPMSGISWANLALARQLEISQLQPAADASGHSIEMARIWFAFNRAKLYGVNEPAIQNTLAALEKVHAGTKN